MILLHFPQSSKYVGHWSKSFVLYSVLLQAPKIYINIKFWKLIGSPPFSRWSIYPLQMRSNFKIMGSRMSDREVLFVSIRCSWHKRWDLYPIYTLVEYLVFLKPDNCLSLLSIVVVIFNMHRMIKCMEDCTCANWRTWAVYQQLMLLFNRRWSKQFIKLGCQENVPF